jgi:tRNA 2-thiouridine synthesizing protein E
MAKDVQNRADLDHDGFLTKEERWTRDLAEFLARENFIVEDKLTDDHWKVIEYIRQYYLECRTGPTVAKVSKATGFSLKRICELFPCGMARGGYRLAGLPRPPGCV